MRTGGRGACRGGSGWTCVVLAGGWLTVAAAGCKSESAAPKSRQEASPAPVAKAPASQPAADMPGSPATTQPVAAPHGAPTTQPVGAIVVDHLVFHVPASWVAQKPSSAMRKAQFKLPGPTPGTDAELVVFNFGRGPAAGGPVQENLDRWIKQFAQDDGRDSREVAVIEQRTINGLEVHTLDLSGRFVAPVRPGQPQKFDEPNSRMLAAILMTPQGNYFLKLVGPKQTIDMHEDNYEAFLTGFVQR